ncbi:MAG: hypothetical protein DMG68_21070, partial [Acidobacteria bacterium]
MHSRHWGTRGHVVDLWIAGGAGTGRRPCGGKHSPTGPKAVGHAAFSSCPGSNFFIIDRYGVNVPYADEWSNLILVEKWDAGHLTFADLFRAHNGHRIFVPRLIFLAFVEMAHGNVRAEMFFSLFICALTSAGLLYLLRRTVRTDWPRILALWVLINVLLFSPIQAENWLWGFQFQIFLSNLCVVGALIAITANLRAGIRLALAA